MNQFIQSLKRNSNQAGGEELQEAIAGYIKHPSIDTAVRIYNHQMQSTGGSLDEVMARIFVYYGWRKSVYGGFSES